MVWTVFTTMSVGEEQFARVVTGRELMFRLKCPQYSSTANSSDENIATHVAKYV